MNESRAVPSGEVYRQLFDAQVQLSRSLLAGRKDTRTDCLSAEDSNTHCSTTSSRRPQQVDEDVADDVSRLPDAVAADRPRSDLVERLLDKRQRKQEAAEGRLSESLSALSEVCEGQVRTAAEQLLSCLRAADRRLDTLRVRMEQLDHVSLQEVQGLWQEVEEEVRLKERGLAELDAALAGCERRRTDELRALLREQRRLLEDAGTPLPPAHAHGPVHAEAAALNQALLANRRSAARLLLRLREEALQQEALLRRHWEERLSLWRRSRVQQVVEQFRGLCGAEQDQGLDQDRDLVSVQRDLTEGRRDIILKMSSLVPPTCSAALISDWFVQLTANNQHIDRCHADLLHRWRCGVERTFQDGLAEAERCREALSALQLSEEEVNDVIASRLLPLIGRRQADRERRSAAFQACSDRAARHALRLSRGALAVLRAAASLWETHRRRLEGTEDELRRRLDGLRQSQQRRVQEKKARVDDLLGALRQGSSEDALKTSLDTLVHHLQDVKESYTQCVCDQREVLERLPSLLMKELLSYCASLSSFFSLSHTYQPSPEEVHQLRPAVASSNQDQEVCRPAVTPGDAQRSCQQPISCQMDSAHTQTSQDWLTEAKSFLLEFYDSTSCNDTFTSSGGVVCTGPAFRCPTLPENLEQETHLSLFPVELLTHTLSRTRTLFLEHLEHHFSETLQSAIAMVTERKEAAVSEQELHLLHLNPQDVHTHLYQPRLAELQRHLQRVDEHCDGVQDVQTSCRTGLQELQSATRRKNEEFAVTLADMQAGLQTACSSRSLQALSSTLQGCVDKHIRDTQRCQSSFRRTVQVRLQEVRDTTAQLLGSFRLFSEGGDFAAQEAKAFQCRLKEATRQAGLTEDAVLSALDQLESQSFRQVKEASAPLEEKLCALRAEVAFNDDVDGMLRSVQVSIRAETISSNQQQTEISSRLEELKKMLESTQVCPPQVCPPQVCPPQVCPLVSSVTADLRRRCQYLDLQLDSALQEALGLSGAPESRVPLPPGPPAGLLQGCRRGADLQDDPVVGVVRSLSRFGSDQDPPAEDGRGRGTESSWSPDQHQQRSTKAVSAASVRGGRGRPDRRFPFFGNGPEVDPRPHSFSSRLDAALGSAGLALLQAAEEFYRRQRHSHLQLLPDSLDQWADGAQQRLLGYREEAGRVLSASRKEAVQQISALDQLLDLVPAALIRNQERQQEAGLKQEVGGVMQKLTETLTASEKEKDLNVLGLRLSLTDEDLQALHCREELRQQRLHSATCSAHLELQECVRARGEEFVTSLGSLMEELLPLLDGLLSPAAGGSGSQQAAEDGTGETRVHQRAAGASMITIKRKERCLSVRDERDAAVKRFQQLVRSELSRSDDDRRREVNKQQSWNTHWRQQIHTLKHTIQQQ